MPSNPILKRELKTLLRARVTFGLAVVYLVLLAALVWWMWPREGIFSLAAQASRSIVLVFTMTQLLLVILYAPAFAASALTSEREQNTFELLFASLLRPRQIVVGKLWSSILCLLLFVVLSLPLFATCFFLGAVSVRETVVIYLVTVASAVVFGLLGLSVSAVRSTSHGALITTYLLILLICGLPWLPYLLLKGQPWADVMVQQVQGLSPLAALASILVPSLESTAAWRTYLVFAAWLSAVMVVFLLVAVYRRSSRPDRPHGGAIDDPRELMKRKLRFPFYLIDPMRRKKNIADWVNPVFAKEMRSKAFGGGIWVFRGAYICFGVSMLLMALVAGNLVGQTPDVIRTVALVFQLGLVVLIVPSLTAGAITQERERNNLDLFRMSRLQAGQVIKGKLIVAAVFVLFLVVGSAPAWYVIYYLGTNTAQEILICWAIIGATMLLAMLTGLAASAVALRTPTATALAYGLMFAIGLGTLLPLLAGEQLTANARAWLFAANPFASAIQVLTAEFFADLPELWRTHLRLSIAGSAALLLLAYLRVRRMLLPDR